MPYAERVSRWLDQLLALVGWPRAHVNVDAATGTLTLTGSPASMLVSFNPDAPIEEQVAYLLRREREAQVRLDVQDERIRAIEEHVPERLEELRAETQEHVEGELSAAESRYRPLRFVGALLLAAGLGLTTAGNFV